MKKRIAVGLASVLFLLIVVLNCPRPAGPLVGDWKGVIDTGNYKLRLLFHVEKGADGNFKATLLSPDQDAKEISGDKVFLGLFTSKAKLPVRAIRGEFTGKFGGSHMTGHWRQGGQAFPLALERIDAAKLALEKTALPPASSDSSEVNQKTGGKLVGTWSGALETPKKPLRLKITISEQDGGLTGILDSPDQGASHIPITKLHLGRTDVIFDFDTIGGHLVANFDSSGNLVGQWDQRGKFYSLTLQKTP